MHILNYNSSFLLDTDSFSFIIFKRLHHTSFKINISTFSKALPSGPPLNPLRGRQCAQTRNCVLFRNSCKTQNFFPSQLMSCVPTYINLIIGCTLKLKMTVCRTDSQSNYWCLLQYYFTNCFIYILYFASFLTKILSVVFELQQPYRVQ